MAHGYAGVSMDDVLREVGGSKSTLYRYFSDKEDLFRSAVELLLQERLREFDGFHMPDADVRECLVALGRHFARVVLAPQSIALHRLVTAETTRVKGLGQTFYANGPAVGKTFLGGYLDMWNQEGRLRVEDPIRAAAQLYEAMMGDLQMRLLVGASARISRREADESIRSAVDVFLDGTAVQARAR